MQTEDNRNPAWLSDRDLAVRYGVNRITVWRWARSGVIPKPRKIGPNTSRWSASEIEAHDAEMANGGEVA